MVRACAVVVVVVAWKPDTTGTKVVGDGIITIKIIIIIVTIKMRDIMWTTVSLSNTGIVVGADHTFSLSLIPFPNRNHNDNDTLLRPTSSIIYNNWYYMYILEWKSDNKISVLCEEVYVACCASLIFRAIG